MHTTDLNTMATAAMQADADETTLLVFADALDDADMPKHAGMVRDKVKAGRHPFTDLLIGMSLVSLSGNMPKRRRVRMALMEAGIPLKWTFYDRRKAIYYIPTDRLDEARRLGAVRSRRNDRRAKFTTGHTS